MSKKCFKCKKKKEISEFYVHKQMGDGHLGKCKSCTKKDVRRRYYDPAFRERIIAYEKARQQNPERRKRKLTYGKTARKRYPGKFMARYRITNAVRSGRISKKPCGVCGAYKVEAHHTDYRKPLQVMWLCRRHHMEAEGKQPF